jgi:hypothetical protein
VLDRVEVGGLQEVLDVHAVDDCSRCEITAREEEGEHCVANESVLLSTRGYFWEVRNSNSRA